jgi:hypothetical protein
MKYINFNVSPNYIGHFGTFGQTRPPVVVHIIVVVIVIIVVAH